ncbi:putative isomerase YraM [Mycena kentingensis (nom. inval.)]|nr:putative isomerase YraM [Mycena kentingensis (nom. inval.)]
MTSFLRRSLPATFLRGGTSKGIFLSRDDLPSNRTDWPAIFLGIMGSPDAQYGRQLNGMGGGISSLSKICIVSPATPTQKKEGIDVEYTFVQVGIRDTSIDYSGNCGNLSSMIGVFARDEGMCAPPAAGATKMTVRAWNSNTSKVIETTFPVEEGVAVLDRPEIEIAGVPGKASRIVMDFVNPGGARTGKLLPSGNAVDVLEFRVPGRGETQRIRASLVDATNPTVLVPISELRELLGPSLDAYTGGTASAGEIAEVSEMLEAIRQQGAVKMGLDPTAQAQPKIAIVSLEDGRIGVFALSMGVLHRALPMTVGLCIGVAANIRETVAWSGGGGDVQIQHPGGIVDVGAEFSSDGSVKSASVLRTGRRLMKGVVYW